MTVEQVFADIPWPTREEDRKQIHTYRRAIRLAFARMKGTHTDQQWHNLFDEFLSRCVRCGAWVEDEPIVKDHIVPISLGGSDGIDNIQPLCIHCNNSKADETFNWVKYRRLRGFEDEHPARKRNRLAVDNLEEVAQ